MRCRNGGKGRGGWRRVGWRGRRIRLGGRSSADPHASGARVPVAEACVHAVGVDVFTLRPNVFSFGRNVFSFGADVFSFGADVFSRGGEVFTATAGPGVRKPSTRCRCTASRRPGLQCARTRGIGRGRRFTVDSDVDASERRCKRPAGGSEHAAETAWRASGEAEKGQHEVKGDGVPGRVRTRFERGGPVRDRWLAEELYSFCVRTASWAVSHADAEVRHGGVDRRWEPTRGTPAGWSRRRVFWGVGCALWGGGARSAGTWGIVSRGRGALAPDRDSNVRTLAPQARWEVGLTVTHWRGVQRASSRLRRAVIYS